MNIEDQKKPDTLSMPKSRNGVLTRSESREFDDIATSVFAPIYPVIAGQILERTEKKRGKAIDAGCGPAHLAIAMAQQSQLKIFAIDSSPFMLGNALKHISRAGLVQRIVPVVGDIHAIPFEEGTIDLVFSRGSWFFWNDLAQAFREIYRVLAPDGVAYIGGGFGNEQLKKTVFSLMKKKDPEFETGVKERTVKNSPDLIRNELEHANIRSYNLIQDTSGFWIVLRKKRDPS